MRTLLLALGCWLSSVGFCHADPWTITRESDFPSSVQGGILAANAFDISVPLPGSQRWLLGGLQAADAGTLYTLDASTAASYGIDWAALSTAWANPVNQSYFFKVSQGASTRNQGFIPSGLNRAAGTTLNSVDFRFTAALVAPKNVELSLGETVRFHGEGAPEPGSFVLLMLATAGVSLFRYHTHLAKSSPSPDWL